jgi:hypothetical protein
MRWIAQDRTAPAVVCLEICTVDISFEANQSIGHHPFHVIDSNVAILQYIQM